MVHVYFFKGIKQIEGSERSLPDSLEVVTLDDEFNVEGSQSFAFQQPEPQEIYSGDIGRIVLEKWRPVMEDVIYSMEEMPRLIFLSERDKRLFITMKNKFRMHTGAVGYYSLEAMTALADSDEKSSEFSAISEELKENYHRQLAEEGGTANAGANGDADANALERKIRSTCDKYGMKISFKSGIAYITTYGGEWYFAYNDRPITLYHKNSKPVKNKNGKLIRHSHIQPVELHSPVHALAYIRNHEAAEEKRLLGEK